MQNNRRRVSLILVQTSVRMRRACSSCYLALAAFVALLPMKTKMDLSSEPETSMQGTSAKPTTPIVSTTVSPNLPGTRLAGHHASMTFAPAFRSPANLPSSLHRPEVGLVASRAPANDPCVGPPSSIFTSARVPPRGRAAQHD